MPARFFGQYLLEQGVVSTCQLDLALRWLDEKSERIGEIALRRGLLTSVQIKELTRIQRNIDCSFGELAIERGYLSRDNLQLLLAEQARCRISIGEALVDLEVIQKTALHGYLDAFHYEESLHNQSRQTSDIELSRPILMKNIEEVFPRLVFRLTGVRVKLSQLSRRRLNLAQGDKWYIARVDLELIKPEGELAQCGSIWMVIGKHLADLVLAAYLQECFVEESDNVQPEEALSSILSVISGNLLRGTWEGNGRGRMGPPATLGFSEEMMWVWEMVSPYGDGWVAYIER
ncbi:MAG: hypothetical protein VYA34_01500 [Myxococcota bacterium]|nr:hypothetical protein [Myxococcota bacterium]